MSGHRLPPPPKTRVGHRYGRSRNCWEIGTGHVSGRRHCWGGRDLTRIRTTRVDPTPPLLSPPPLRSGVHTTPHTPEEWVILRVAQVPDGCTVPRVADPDLPFSAGRPDTVRRSTVS